MDLLTFSAVLFSAFFQASWNFATKRSSSNKVTLIAVGWGLAGTTLLSVIFQIHPISKIGAIGIVSVIAGTFLIGWKELPQKDKRGAFLIALLVALTVSGYSIVDSVAAKRIPNFFLIAVMNILPPLLASPYLILRYKKDLVETLRTHKLESLFVAFARFFAYGIVLWAYQRSATAYVASLREFSVVVACLLGLIFLKEALYKRKIVGIALIVLGVALIKVA
jgi:drug/metabolite transporter (DMT)-like permease